ncbi:MAG: DUF1501 domain-containing protein [Myxococcota bacterium]
MSLGREISRRRFLQALAASGAGGAFATLLPEQLLGLARPLPSGEPILISIFLGGGLDAAHLLVPIGANDYGHYADQRGALAVDSARVLPLTADAGVNAVMPRLHARALAGEVAFVRGVDLLGASGFDPLSHFDKTDYVMSGRSTPGGPSGIWARWADLQPDNPLLLSTVAFGLPRMFSGGARAQATSLPASLDYALGAGSGRDEQLLAAALGELASAYPGISGALDARLAHSGAFAIEVASGLAGVYPPAQSDESALTRNLRVIASLVNANLTGTRIYATLQGGYDTHENQRYDLEQKLLPDLDASLEALFAELDASAHVVVMIWTEFGRRAGANVSGTDHGAANDVIVIGQPVAGGVYGAQPSFDPARLDARGNLRAGIAFESIYAELIDRFLGGDSRSVLGAPFSHVQFMR